MEGNSLITWDHCLTGRIAWPPVIAAVGLAVTVVPPAAAYMAACYSSLEVTVIIFMLAYSGF